MDSGFIGRIRRNVRYENICLEQEIRAGTLPPLPSAPQGFFRKTIWARYYGFIDIFDDFERRKH